MAATITELTTNPERLRQDQADQLRAALRTIEGQMELPIDLVRSFHKAIEKRTASRKRWIFVMISPTQNAAVVDYLSERSCRPLLAVRMWAMCLIHLCFDTGEILLSRDEIADGMRQQSRTISQLMSELESFGAIIKRRQKQAGMKGPGIVRYFVNPRVATHLSGQERDAAQIAAPPLLVLMEGGKSD